MEYGSMVWGSESLNHSIIIESNNNGFSFDVDSIPYLIEIDEGSYITNRDLFTSDLIPQINIKLIAEDAPVRAILGGINGDTHKNILVFEHQDKDNSHDIDNFDGTAKDIIFGEIMMTTPPTSI